MPASASLLLACLLCVLLGAKVAAEEPLHDKTLVVWASPASLDQRGGSALTLDGWHGRFDGIVFGEIAPRRWMAGSTGFLRTSREQDSWPVETVAPGEVVQIAVAYRGQEVAIYRNGEVYASYTMANPAQPFEPNSVVMFGKRHLDGGLPHESFTGTIRDARVYASALDQATIASLKPNEAGGPEPWAWWSFTDGRTQEQTGRYAEVRLYGDVRPEPDGLILGGNGATLIAYPHVALAGPASTWADGEPVPRPVIEGARTLRGHLLADRYRPGYHFVMPEDNGVPGDPNGALFWNGRYHLMYLFHDGRAFVWGHASSKDLVHWRYHPTALGPGEGDTGIFSGGAFVDGDGVAWLSYWGLAEGPGQGICLASSTDEHLDRWTKSPGNPVIRSTHWGYTVATDGEGRETVYGSADPSNIWERDGRYYLLTGNLLVLNRYGTELGQVEHQGDTAYLCVSDDLKTWRYLHPFYESRREWTHPGEDNMCPVFLPLPASPDGGPCGSKHLLLFISHCDGCQYYTGRYEGDRFLPEQHGRMTWIDNQFFAPEALLDDRGRLIMWAWLLDNPPQSVTDAQGWQGAYGLPRVLWLDEQGRLGIRPAPELQMLRQQERSLGPLGLEADADRPWAEVQGDQLELELMLEPGEGAQCGVSVCCSSDGQEQTLVYYDAAERKLKVDTTRSSLGFGKRVVEAAPLELAPDEALALRVFVDKSVVEVYANDRQAISRRVYPTLDSTGVVLFSRGASSTVTFARAWEMMPSNPF